MFGQNNKSLFGAPNTTSAFGQPNTSAFGAQPTASTGPFGAMNPTQTPQQPSIFGQSLATTNQPLFGSTQTSIFGSTPNTGTTNTFGQMSGTNTFGGSASLFGGTQQNNTLFGANRFGTTATASPFGSISMAPTMAAPNGTTVKFNATAGTDTMMKNGVSQNINTRHQCITCMREYESKSLEELRLEDYTANRKGPQQNSGMFGTTQSAPTSNLFGTSTTPQNAFSSTSNTGLFGQTKPAFGSLAPTTTSSGSGLFSSFNQNKPMFGTNTTFPSVQTQVPTTSMFGSVSTSNPTLNNSFFSGNTNTTAAVKPLFGGTTVQPQQPLFGQTNAQNTLTNTQKPLFGNQTTSVPQFGTNTNTLFNPNTTSNLFSSSQSSLFNPGPTAANNTLAKPLFNFNNPTSMPLNSSIGGTGVTSTPSLFGNTSNTFGNTGSMFGTSNPTNFNFGSTNPSFQSNAFQPNVGLQPISSATQSVSTDQLVTRFQTFPYGDYPQIHIDLTIPSNTKLSTKFTTDPKTLNQYKISAKTIDSRPKRIVNSPKVNAMLFDGLEDDNSDENKTAKDIFVPRRDVKKLVFKPKPSNTSSMANIDVSQNSPINPNNSSNSSNFLVQINANKSGIKFDDSVVSDITVNEFIRNDNKFAKQMDSIPKQRLMISPSEKGDDMLSLNASITSESVRECSDSGSICSERITSPVVPKCGVILNRTDYYTIPSLNELDNYYDLSSDTCFVPNFTVGRQEYGSVYWNGPIDVKGLDLDEIVHIRRKEVIVYTDEEATPNVGDGLNRSAQITLHQVWPIDKTTHELIKDKDRLRTMKYTEKIEAATIKLGANFKEYRPDTGSWVFTVKHFSKYGLTEDDDEEVVVQHNQTSKQTAPKQSLTKESIENKKKLFSKDVEHRDSNQESLLNTSSDELSANGLKSIDNTMNYLFDEDVDEEVDLEVEHSYDQSFQLSTKLSEFDKMRSTLFDEYEEMVTKKTKTYPQICLQKEIKSKFSPIVPSITRHVVSKKREITFEPDVFAAENKIICDISAVCISNSPKLTFFSGSRRFCFIKGSTVLICELNLFELKESVVDRFEEQLKNNSKVIQSPNQSIAPFIETKELSRNSHNSLGLELLVEALYGPLTEVTPYACHQQRIDRIQIWLFSANKKLSIPKTVYSKIIHFLSTNELEVSVNEALSHNNPRLASLLAIGNNINKDLMIAQLDSWKRSKADLFIEYDLMKIYVLLSGLIEWKLSNGTVVLVLEGLHWTQQLALILLYKTPPEVENSELGLNLLLTSISSLTVAPDEVEYHLLAGHTPWVAMCWAPTPLDSWFIHESLKSFRVIIDENELISLSDCVHCFVASQIPDLRWACFVAIHIRNDSIRQMVVKEIIGRNSWLLTPDSEKWLSEKLSIPLGYLSEAKAIQSKAGFDYRNVATNLIDCQQWAEAHEVLMDRVFPQMIINEENDSIVELILKLKPNSHLISNWYSNGGHIYETYLKCLQSSNIEDIKSFNIHQFKCQSKLHVLCQSEMARKVNIIFSELNGGQFAYNTPVPDDYALNELKINANNLIKLLC